jgi:membrane associated rhomboid family serine protease
MFFPIRDVIPSFTTPFATWTIIALNILLHLLLMTAGPAAHEEFIVSWGVVPAAFSWAAVATSMFIHADLLHLGSNMISLWIFGDNVEDQMGHGRFLAFYFGCGTVAALAETWAAPGSLLPMVGASGAIAGVMGAYLVMFPRSRVLVLLFLVFYVNVVEIPAVFFLAFWFFLQVVGGLSRSAEAASTGGVAFWAHAGGFMAGVVGARALRRKERIGWEWREPRRPTH